MVVLGGRLEVLFGLFELGLGVAELLLHVPHLAVGELRIRAPLLELDPELALELDLLLLGIFDLLL